MMMLTLTTAKEMNVENRLDAEQSLSGGTRYFLRLRRNLPERIPEPDRSWFALAAYNVGRGHLEDARRLAEHQGMNPDSWYDVKQVLPLLSDPEWHSRTRYGFARGHEPVHYVQQIRYYYNVLSHGELANLLSVPPEVATDEIESASL
jgi:membrane-bound lytic murein transglycosylase F